MLIPMSASLIRNLYPAFLGLILVGCGRKAENGEPADSNPPPTQVEAVSEDPVDLSGPVAWNQELIHKATKHFNPAYSGQGQFYIQEGRILAAQLGGTGVTDLTMLVGQPLQMVDLQGLKVEDLTALTGAPLQEVYLENTRVTDLTPLARSPIQKLYLSNTPVSDLTPLAECPVTEMNLINTGVGDLSPLSRMPLQMLWLTGSPVRDLSPLKTCPLVSLTLENTPVTDLSPLGGTALQRLHIGNTPVTDLSPLDGMRLTRLIFNPERITEGMDAIRGMTSLTELGTSFDRMLRPPAFWSMYPKKIEDQSTAPSE